MATDLNKYVQAAKSTESVVDEIKINKADFSALLDVTIGIANILDQLKKHVFYGREYDAEFLSKNHRLITNNLETLQRFVRNPTESSRTEDAITNTRTAHGLIGIITEAGELAEVLQSLNNTGDVDSVNVGEEIGDLDWYKAILADSNGLDLEKILEVNIKKLEDRYKKKKFEAEAANVRNLDSERTVLSEVVVEVKPVETIATIDIPVSGKGLLADHSGVIIADSDLDDVGSNTDITIDVGNVEKTDKVDTIIQQYTGE